MLMIDILKYYLLIGFVLIGIEWVFLILGRHRLFESEETAEKVAEGLAFFFEIFIWPYQVFAFIDILIRFHKGTLSQEEWNIFDEGYQQGTKLREKLHHIKGGLK